MKKKLQIPHNHNNPIARLGCRLLLLLFCLSLQSFAFAALPPPDFTLTVTPTDETCLGNGTLTFSVTGVDPASTVTYTVFQLPNETTPIAVQTELVLGGRSAGTYKVVATQTLNGESNAQTVTATINNNIVPLEYTISSTNSVCADGVMTLTVTSSVGTQYEIISGPVTRPLQTSPVFGGLPAGIYEVRAFNACGDGTVITHTVLSDSSNIIISDASFPNRILPDCNTISAANMLTTQGDDILAYPLTLHYTVRAPNGTVAQESTVVVPSGDAELYNALLDIPFYYDQVYFYDLTVTDACGNVFTHIDIPVHQMLTAQLTAQTAECGANYLSVTAGCYVPGFTVEWLEFPAGFAPADMNPGHPGPFAESADYGDYNNPLPYGHYVVKITDACGRTATAPADLIDEPAVPEKEVEQYVGCLSYMSKITIRIPGFEIVTAVITVAPPEYLPTLPDDVSDMINVDHELFIDPLVAGDYVVILTDECGNTYEYPFTIPPLNTSVTPTTRPDCEIGKGGVRISGSAPVLTSVIMTAAPAGFNQTLPYDVSFNLTTGGVFSMTGLPPGIYSFTVVDNCGETHMVTQNVTGYEITANDFVLTPHCGAFDITLTHSANGVSQSFWLQALDPVTNTWGHPLTHVVYPEGTIPNNVNSFLLQTNTTTYNIEFTGQFRILKRFESYNNGSVGEYKQCYEILKEFEFTGIFEITGFEKITCSGALADIKVLTNGVPPLTYMITHKDGIPFVVDNGTNNIFTDLEPAIYTFQVQQSCGDIAPGITDVAQLPSLANANQPADMSTCDDSSNDGIGQFLLTDQNAAVLGTQNAVDFTITYHLTMADAEADVNPLPANYTSGNDEIFCRMEYNGGDQCFDIVSFDLIVNPYPVLQMPLTWGLCEGASTTITADPGLLSYLWSTGETTPSITVNTAGQYTLQVTKAYPTGNCDGTFTINVVQSNAPVIERIDFSDWTDDENTITVILDANGTGDYVYSLDGINYQESNTFTDLPPGPYFIYVKDARGCGMDDGDVFLLNYPKYFTPNGDGIHDFWQIKYSQREPHLMTYVFDRYGKLITGFLPDDPGWDGTLNGEPLPSTDYWFLVIRENGKYLRGHFAMKR